jgi:hypothetical protein
MNRSASRQSDSDLPDRERNKTLRSGATRGYDGMRRRGLSAAAPSEALEPPGILRLFRSGRLLGVRGLVTALVPTRNARPAWDQSADKSAHSKEVRDIWVVAVLQPWAHISERLRRTRI